MALPVYHAVRLVWSTLQSHGTINALKKLQIVNKSIFFVNKTSSMMATDAAVSMVLNRLLPKIENKVRDEVSLLLNADKEVKALSFKLEKIHQVLADAERRGIKDRDVKFWLDELQEIAYEVDFALDQWEVENIRQKFEEVQDSSLVKAFLRSVSFFFKKIIGRRCISLDVRQINDRLDTISQRSKDEFKFIPYLGGRDSTATRPNIITTSYVDEGEVHGRNLEKDILTKKLLSSNSDLQIISIFGTGGMGKTTLAQLVFRQVKDQFDKAMWVYVSNPFDQIKVAQAILEALDKKSPEVSSLQALLDRIEESLLGKKFILVLDDVWTEDHKTWEPFKITLQSGSPGSRILVTTRKSIVAEQVMESAYTHELGRLSDTDCFSVLEQRALSAKNNNSDHHMLRGVAMEIAKKCDGMPLAATIIGGLLRFKTSIEEWENVLDSEWWDKMREGVFPFLALSYNELDPVVRRCFSFCAIFPKGERIEVDSLVRIWMAQGFLASSGKVSMERKGLNYFKQLRARSLFQDYERDEFDGDRVISFRIHDVVRGFAQSLTKNECLVAEDKLKSNDDGVSRHNIWHLNIQGNKAGVTISASTILSSVSTEKLHSLLLYRSYEVPSDIFSQLKRVKWLSLSCCLLKDIPEEIGSLIHLRLLDLSRNLIRKLPEKISELYNLQTLNISYCVRLSGLPQKIERLMNLSHITNTDTKTEDFEFPSGFEKLTSLQTLQNYNCNKLGYLKDMDMLRGSLSIRLTKLSELEAERANLKSKRCLRDLSLLLYENVDYEVIELLRPHQNLQSLYLLAQKIPSWLIDNVNNLRKLTMTIYSSDKRALSLPCLGRLRLLEYLRMNTMDGMTHIGNEFVGIDEGVVIESFPKLKRLIFDHCGSWEEWDDMTEDRDNNSTINVLPRLEELIIQYCKELKSLPCQLLWIASSLKHMKIVSCPHLRRRYHGQDEWDFSVHIPHVEFLQ